MEVSCASQNFKYVGVVMKLRIKLSHPLFSFPISEKASELDLIIFTVSLFGGSSYIPTLTSNASVPTAICKIAKTDIFADLSFIKHDVGIWPRRQTSEGQPFKEKNLKGQEVPGPKAQPSQALQSTKLQKKNQNQTLYDLILHLVVKGSKHDGYQQHKLATVKNFKADVSSTTPSSEQMTKG